MEMKTRDCRGFYVNPSEMFRSKEYILNDVEETEPTSDVVSFVKRYHRDHKQDSLFIPLKECRRGERLVPYVVSNDRSYYH